MKKSFLLFFFIPLFSCSQDKKIFHNLVFEGGGIRGLAYAGAIKALDEKGVLQHIERTAGSSAGAVSALLISLGYSAMEIDSLLSSLSMQSFNDGKWMFIGGLSRFRKNYGWYRGNEFENWIKNIIAFKAGKPDISFRELHELTESDKRFKDFYCTGTNLSLQRSEVFGYTTTPGMEISTAVRISISIPLYFGAVFLDENNKVVKPVKGKKYTVYIDGGLLANYPLTIFDTCNGDRNGLQLSCDYFIPNINTLGMKLERTEQISNIYSGSDDLAGFKIINVKTYIGALYNVLFETVNMQSKIADEKNRTIYISTAGISPRIRRLKDENKNTLVQNGYKGVQQYFESQ